MSLDRWYVVHTHSRQEDRVDNNLKAWGVETFNPKIRESLCRPYAQTLSFVIKPLFPGYLFARFDMEKMLHNIRYTRGVHSLVSTGMVPTPLEDTLVSFMQSRLDENGFIQLVEDLRPGDVVSIHHGPLQSFEGVFVRRMKGSDRVMILLQSVNYQAHVIVDKSMVKRVDC